MVRGEHVYLAIDLKSFYASVECHDRGLDPLRTHLVVADEERTDKTICLAVSPSLKAYGIPGRARLFEVRRRLASVNAERAMLAPGGRLSGESCDSRDLEHSPRLKASMVIAKPRMAHYLEVSGRVYGVYLRYAAPEHIHVYSIDEVFIDATPYLRALGMGPHEMARAIVRDILAQTGITATAGIGTNMYLAKVAMDIVAKHMPADEDGVRVAELDEMSYRRLLWNHRPLTDFWRVGRGYARKLEHAGLLTMGDVARCSIGRASDYYNEDLLYRMFGRNAELLIDHAWGWEPCTIADIQSYEPDAHSISSGQVLTGPADYATGRLIVKEMADALALDLVGKRVLTNRLTLAVGYDIGSLDSTKRVCWCAGSPSSPMMWPRRMSLRPANATSSLICFPGSIRPRRRGTMAMSAFRTVMCGVSMTCRLHCWRSRGNSAAMPSSRRWTWRTAPPARTAIGRSEAIVHEHIERIALSGVKRSPYGIT